MKTIIAAAVVALISTSTTSIAQTTPMSANSCKNEQGQIIRCAKHWSAQDPDTVMSFEHRAHHEAWCDRISNRNISCPKGN